MSEELKNIYARAHRSADFFDASVPIDLYRRRKIGDKTPIMQPTIIGFGKAEDPRLPDIYLEDESGKSPQFNNGDMVREPGSKPVTQQIVADAAKYVVRGCRTVKGDYRGVSVFDEIVQSASIGAEWFFIPEGTEIPAGLAITRDGIKKPGRPLHYTVAPKDNMPFGLFLAHLKGLEAAIKKQAGK